MVDLAAVAVLNFYMGLLAFYGAYRGVFRRRESTITSCQDLIVFLVGWISGVMFLVLVHSLATLMKAPITGNWETLLSLIDLVVLCLVMRKMIERFERKTGHAEASGADRCKVPVVYVLGFATVIPAALFFTDFPAIAAAAFVTIPIIIITLFYGYRNRPFGWSGVAWALALVFFSFVVLPVFWYFRIYLPHSRNQLTLAAADAHEAARR